MNDAAWFRHWRGGQCHLVPDFRAAFRCPGGVLHITIGSLCGRQTAEYATEWEAVENPSKIEQCKGCLRRAEVAAGATISNKTKRD